MQQTVNGPQQPTTTLPPPTTTTTAPHYQLVAHLQPMDGSTATVTVGADDLGGGSWRITVTAYGLSPNLAHTTSLQGKNTDGSRTEIRAGCEFTSAADGTGGCTATVAHGWDPAWATLGAYDSRSNGYASVADGAFGPG